jgi:hypothetical protein
MEDKNSKKLGTQTINRFDINTAKIWQYERSTHSLEKSNHRFGKDLLRKLQTIIISRGGYDFASMELAKRDKGHLDHIEIKVLRYEECLESLDKGYQIDYFFDDNNNQYFYDNPIIISRNDPDFEFWFIMSLRHFTDNIFEIEKFLDYQFKNNLKQDGPAFLSFLTLSLRNYSEILTEKVKITTQEWLKNIAIHPNKNNGKNKVVHNSFKLKGVKNFSEYFLDNRNRLNGVYTKMQNNFIDDKNQFFQFKNIFSGEKIAPEKRINWIGSRKELNNFVKLINKTLQKIEPINYGKWVTTTKCFTLNGEEIEPDSLRRPNGSIKRIPLLQSILENL